ncbi:hypothetical protein AB5L52_06825 [Streptomyces sp. CG4]|uniref:hypothetical protein n=1 Tax=Streptomyces sp. CG4 TaxID=408783 RepID=UPI0034E29353
MPEKNPPGSPEPVSWPNPSSAAGPNRGGPTGGTGAGSPPQPPQRPEEFPPEGEVEYERSVIRIPFNLKGAAPGANRQVDVMVFDAYMRLVRQAPVTNGLGFRQFEFTIDAWELTNTFSPGLNANVTFTLSDTVQPRSICIASQRERDYPSLIVYSAIYDVYLGTTRIVENQPGVAYATPVWEIPPRNVTVAFEKPFESDQFSFSAGTCEGMRAITREEFEAGAAAARAVRGQS